MTRISFSIAVSLLGTIAAWPAQPDSARLARAVVLEHAEFKLTPAALVFDEKGELYAGYRDEGAEKKSSAIWIRVFDPVSGKELRRTQLQTATVPLPNGAEQFLLSLDNSMLLYAQFHGGTLIIVLNAGTFQKVSETTNLPDDVSKHFPSVNSISSDGGSVLIEAGVTNRLNGNDVQLVKLNTHDLTRVLSDLTLTNPIPESGFSVDRDGTIWISRANGLYSYDRDRGKATLELSVHNQDDIKSVLHLNDQSLLLWSGQNEFGYLYRFNITNSTLEESRRIDGCGVESVHLSPDRQYGAALCEHQRTGEWHFGAITSRTAVIFDTKTLKILAQVPIEKDLYPELAIWHGGEKIVLVTQADSNKLAIYEFPAPKQSGQSATVNSKDGSLRIQVPVVASAKPKQ